MHLIHGKTFSDAYMQALYLVTNKPDYVCKPRGLEINECLDVCLEIDDPSKTLVMNSVRSTPINYLKKELALYLAGCFEASAFIKASKFWERSKNDDGTINSAYGHLVFGKSLEGGKSQFDWAYDKLVEDKDSRQAVVFFNQPKFQYKGVKDFVCTLDEVFHIRGEKLYAAVSMRSNDIYRGTITDIPFFALVQQLLLEKLRKIYPDLVLGPLTYYGHSLHLYHNLVKSGSDLETAKKMLMHSFESAGFPMPKDPDNIIQSNYMKSFAESDEINMGEVSLGNRDFIVWLISNV